MWPRILHIVLEPEVDPRADEYTPFLPAPKGLMGAHIGLAAQLVRVCRSWHTLLLPTLCQDIQLGRGPIPLLKHARRVVLSYASTDESTVEQLRQCTDIRILCRPHWSPQAYYIGGYNQDAAPAIALPSLQRLECDIPPESNCTGINSLVDTLLQSQNLRYLYLNSRTGIEIPQYLPTRVELPLLETLRIHYQLGYTIQHLLAAWVLPTLKSLILDNPLIHANLEGFWASVGKTLTRVELGPTSRFQHYDYLDLCLQHCPVLQDLGYYVWAANPPSHRRSHARLQRLRLHLGRWIDFTNRMLQDHLTEFNHPGMPSLTTCIELP